MEMTPGYVQTDVSVIPDEWDVVSIGELFTFKNGLNKSKRFFGHGTPIVNYMDVYGRPALRIEQIAGRVDVSDKELDAYNVRKGDVFFTRTSETIEEIGVASVMLDDPESTVYSGFVLRARPTNDSLADAFKAYCFSPRYLRQQITARASYTTRALTNGRSLSAVLLARPPLPEQRAIATALSDVDALLGGLDQLIAKKRDLKQAAMQQLLTGQTRLPGFHDEWEVKRLDMVADVLKGSGLSKSQTTSSGVRPCILYGELFTAYGRIIADVVGRTNSIDGCNSQQGDVLMPGSTTTTGSDLAIASALLVDGVALGGDIIIIRRKDDSYDSVFLANYLTHAKKQEIAEFTQGITIHHLYGKNMRGLSLDLPHPSEQTAIAAVLSDMDAELAALEARRDKTRNLKQAMMQELLTGKTRLVTPEVAHA